MLCKAFCCIFVFDSWRAGYMFFIVFETLSGWIFDCRDSVGKGEWMSSVGKVCVTKTSVSTVHVRSCIVTAEGRKISSSLISSTKLPELPSIMAPWRFWKLAFWRQISWEKDIRILSAERLWSDSSLNKHQRNDKFWANLSHLAWAQWFSHVH